MTLEISTFRDFLVMSLKLSLGSLVKTLREKRGIRCRLFPKMGGLGRLTGVMGPVHK